MRFRRPSMRASVSPLPAASRRATAACICSLSAASGVRSSCAASATKVRCACEAARSRSSRSLSASTSGRISVGTRLVQSHRFERFERAARERARQPADRRKPARDDEQHEHDGHRNEHDERPERAQRELEREFVAHEVRLRDLHEAIGLLDAEHAPAIPLAIDRSKALADARQRGLLQRVIDELAGLVPDVDDEPVVGDAPEVVARGARRRRRP